MSDPIIVEIGEMPDRIRQFAEFDGHRATVGARGDAALRLARILVTAGYDPARPYWTARRGRISMRYATLAHAAKLTVTEQPKVRIVPFTPTAAED